MFDWIRQRVLHFMRVPHAPEPPLGAPDSVRVFRAGRNYYKLRLARWILGQTGAVAGILFSVSFLYWFKGEVAAAQAYPANPAALTPATPPPVPVVNPGADAGKPEAKPKRAKGLTRQKLKVIARRMPWWALPLIEVLELGGILLFLVQLPVTFATIRLEFELHWYIVTDRSLRIRTGLLRLQESTMSFANLQQVEVKQGPLQRLLGLADLRVQSAGGGSDQPERHGGESLHTGIFHSVDNATEIRDLILERLRKFRAAGLGDPDDHGQHPPAAPSEETPHGGALAAAHEVLAETRALRQALG